MKGRMSKHLFVQLAVWSCAGCLYAQTPETIAGHIVWERDFPQIDVSSSGGAAVDHDGNLWAVSDFPSGAGRLLSITMAGNMRLNAELPPEIDTDFPARIAMFKLAVSPSGVLALLARYNHTVGSTFYFDGATIASVNPDGKLAQPKRVAGGGPEYKEFIALSDGHFLVLGDQSPMIVLSVDNNGSVSWRRTFPSNWVLPSAASLLSGGSCVVSPDYIQPILHMIWMSEKGAVLHRLNLPGQRSQAASGAGSSCAILFSRSAAQYKSEYLLANFDRQFNRAWTTRVLASSPSGGGYHLAAVKDGYVVAIDTNEGGLFVAKYGLGGQLLWSATDNSRKRANLLISAGDDFYLVGAGPKGKQSLHIIRGR